MDCLLSIHESELDKFSASDLHPQVLSFPVPSASGDSPFPVISRSAAHLLVVEAKKKLSATVTILDKAREIAASSGLSVDSSILDASYQSTFLPARFCHGIVTESNLTNGGNHTLYTENRTHENGLINPTSSIVLSTSAGFSNTNHVIEITGDPRLDKIAEYKRSYKRRAKAMQPEERGMNRWDQPRAAGVRRRRILRDSDSPLAPPEPPSSGYVCFIAQMTVKVRHDRPNVHHNQVKVVRELSRLWKFGMSEKDRAYYVKFVKDAREEYKQQLREFRATGTYTPSKMFEKMGNGLGPWVRLPNNEKNALEKELATYTSIVFPPRPTSIPQPEWEKKRKVKTNDNVTKIDEKVETDTVEEK